MKRTFVALVAALLLTVGMVSATTVDDPGNSANAVPTGDVDALTPSDVPASTPCDCFASPPPNDPQALNEG